MKVTEFIGGAILGILFILLLTISGCVSSKKTNQKEILFGSLTSEQIESIQKYYESNPNTTDTVIVQPWMGSELINN